MPYEPMPILDFEGISQEREALISPENAFQSINNGHVRRGRLHKRDGYGHKQKLGVSFTDDILTLSGGALGATSYTFNIPDAPSAEYAGLEILRPMTTYEAGFYNVTINATLDILGTPTAVTYVLGPDDDPNSIESPFVGSIQYKFYAPADLPPALPWDYVGGFTWFCPEKVAELGTGWTYPATVVLNNLPYPTDLGGPNPTITYERHIDYPIVGSTTYVYTDGSEYNLILNTKRAWKLDDTQDRYMPLEHSLGDIWTGDETNRFWLAPFGDILTINNGVDAPYKYDPGAAPGSQIAAMATNFDGTPGNDIDAAEMALAVLGYLVYIGTNENGTWHRGRVRWTQNGNGEAFNDATDYLDAPDNDIIVSAGVVDGEVYCGFRDISWWKLASTSDPQAAFTWVPVEAERGAVAKHGTIELADRIISRSRFGLNSASRIGQRDEAPQLGDVPLGWDAETAYLTQAVRYDELGQAWWNYTEPGEATPQHALVMQMEEGSAAKFSTYDLPIHTMGSYRTAGTFTWDSVATPWDQIPWSWDNAQSQAGFPKIIGGDLDGRVWEWSGRTSDQTDYPLKSLGQFRYAGVAIPFSAKTIRLSPYPGQQPMLGWVDLLVAPSTNGTLELKFTADFDTAAYHSCVLSLDPAGSASEKKLLRVPVFHIAGMSHTIELIEETTGGLTIDAFIPYFQPMGPNRVLA